jgi:ABC-type polysaccharide/polyol phosphate export permease
MLNDLMKTMSLLYELAEHEIKAQRKETFFGMIWMVAWPVIQAGGFIIAFTLIKGGALSGGILSTYIGVLVWSSCAMMFTSSLSFFAKNEGMIKHLSFPFHLILVNDINVKYVFFFFQLVIATAIYLFTTPTPHLTLTILSTTIFIVAIYFLTIGLCWIASLIGAILPDISFALPPILMLLLTLSPVFHRDMSTMPWQIQLLNNINPLSFLVTSYYNCLGVFGEVQIPFGLLALSLTIFCIAWLIVRRAYQEIAKTI